jgi:hypothetical protein
MHAVLFDEEATRKELLPLTFTRPVAAIRFGILTMAMKWQHALGNPCGYLTQSYLSGKFPRGSYPDPVFINACFCPDPQLISAISALGSNEVLFAGGQMVACFGDPLSQAGKIRKDYNGTPLAIRSVTDLFTKNDVALKADFQALSRGRKSESFREQLL